jgi:hypothetical protein
MNQSAQTGGDAVSAGTARPGAKGHFLQLEWDGTDSIRERYEAVRPLAGHDLRLAHAHDFDLGRQFDVAFTREFVEHLDTIVAVAYDPDNPGGSRDAGHTTSR